MKKLFLVLMVGIFMMSFASADLIDDISSYFKLDNSTLREEITGIDGTNVGSVNTSGKILSARQTNGISQFINYSDNFDLTSTSATWNAWVRIDSYPSTVNWVASKDDETDGRSFAFGVGNAGGGICFYIYLWIGKL